MAVERKGIGKVAMIFACGTALFSDGYQNGCIGSVNTMLKRIYGKVYTQNNHGTVFSGIGFAGIVVGQLFFGFLSDKIPRRTGMIICSFIVALFALLMSGAYGAGGSITGMLAALSAYRFLMGIGIGGEYPCGAVASAENTEDPTISKVRQNVYFSLSTNTMIDLGFVIGAFVPLVMVWIFGNDHLRAAWRLTLGLGAIPALAVLFWRFRMHEPELAQRHTVRHGKIPYGLAMRKYWREFLGVSISWWIYDFIAYPFGIYSSSVLDLIYGDDTSLVTIFGWNTVINLWYVPGTVVGAIFLAYVGPKYTMIIGLLLQAVFGFAMSGAYNYLAQPSHVAGFCILYGLFLSFGEFGPGNCLGLLASKSFPTPVRASMYGMCAAIGKIGAYIGVWVWPEMIAIYAADDPRANTTPFYVGSGLAVFSAIIVYFLITECKADHMHKIDQEFIEYLQQHGYDVSQLGVKGSDIDPFTLEGGVSTVPALDKTSAPGYETEAEKKY